MAAEKEGERPQIGSSPAATPVGQQIEVERCKVEGQAQEMEKEADIDDQYCGERVHCNGQTGEERAPELFAEVVDEKGDEEGVEPVEKDQPKVPEDRVLRFDKSADQR